VTDIGVARIFSGGALFSSKKLTTFLVVPFKTQAKTTTLRALRSKSAAHQNMP